jgi:cysteinyl-tRNA synthetase
MTSPTPTIKLYNTKTRRKEDFVPIKVDDVRMYVCGPTVYDRAHIGNARPVIVFDVLYRLLRHAYGPDHVTYVRNFTDVDDKINARAASSGRSIGEITDETIQWFLDDMGAVGALQPSMRGVEHTRAMPRATAYIKPMVAMIEDLIAKGHAYEAEGHALFRVRSYKDYGALSGRSVDDMIAGARVDVAPFKEDPMDFVLWKPSDADTPGWDGPVVNGKMISRGRPGWHIECSAMAHELVGAHFDIHGGGNDLTFPHHENEIAQSACVGHEFAKVWMHNEMLQVEGKKMSKSLGNFFTVRDLLDQGVPGEVIRFVFLSTHYRKPMDWTEKKRDEAEKTLIKWYRVTNGVEPKKKVMESLVDWLRQDLNVSEVLTRMRRFATENGAPELKAAMLFLGFPPAEDVQWFRDRPHGVSVGGNLETMQVGDAMSDWRDFLNEWQSLRNEKQYEKADFLKGVFKRHGVEVRSTGLGPQAQSLFGYDAEALKKELEEGGWLS